MDTPVQSTQASCIFPRLPVYSNGFIFTSIAAEVNCTEWIISVATILGLKTKRIRGGCRHQVFNAAMLLAPAPVPGSCAMYLQIQLGLSVLI